MKIKKSSLQKFVNEQVTVVLQEMDGESAEDAAIIRRRTARDANITQRRAARDANIVRRRLARDAEITRRRDVRDSGDVDDW